MTEYMKKPGYSAPSGSLGSGIVALNTSGVGVGSYDDRNDGQRHRYIGREDGSSETIDPLGSTSTDLHGIDDANDIVGTYGDGEKVDHGFARLKTGAYVNLDNVIQGGADTSRVTAMRSHYQPGRRGAGRAHEAGFRAARVIALMTQRYGSHQLASLQDRHITKNNVAV